jgi:hypothetical protein
MLKRWTMTLHHEKGEATFETWIMEWSHPLLIGHDVVAKTHQKRGRVHHEDYATPYSNGTM